MKKIILIMLFSVLTLGFLGCGRRYAKGKYIPHDEIILRSDKFVESDLQQIARHFVDSLAADQHGSDEDPPKIVISLVTNSTDEHIDMESLTDKIKVGLHKSKRFQFVNAKLRGAVADEYKYNESGFVDPATARRQGRQLGADYLISGNIASIKQPVGRQEIVYYKMTLELTNLSTNVISWAEDIEIKKRFRKRYTGT